MSEDSKKVTFIDPFRVRSRSEPKRPHADVILDLRQAGQMHTLLVAARSASKRAREDAYKAYQEAQKAHVKIYGALCTLESEMEETYKRLGFTDFSEFVTLDKEDDDAS